VQEVRADDVIVLIKSQRAGERVMRRITRTLHMRPKLAVNPASSEVATISQCSFLGFTLRGNKFRWTDKVLASFKHRVRTKIKHLHQAQADCPTRRRILARQAHLADAWPPQWQGHVRSRLA